ncbi:hypothetical protein CEXT_735851 [Caerostris extrusa]|uniref:Uncharacterized protein n=1 Tax=Caerostris extrusa TaxID=172846 RepID=A0AAV4XZL6_CAEEX|nr:hypothetical protein CEXT_735851 [Caerostris extrusa]
MLQKVLKEEQYEYKIFPQNMSGDHINRKKSFVYSEARKAMKNTLLNREKWFGINFMHSGTTGLDYVVPLGAINSAKKLAIVAS